MEFDLMFLKKTPPHNLEAEKTVLGGILVNNKNLNVVLSIISPEDFYKDSYRYELTAKFDLDGDGSVDFPSEGKTIRGDITITGKDC